jgi:hypothetical protein
MGSGGKIYAKDIIRYDYTFNCLLHPFQRYFVVNMIAVNKSFDPKCAKYAQAL